MSINKRLENLGIILPEPIAPIANYVPFVQSGNQIFISGQLPIKNGEVKFVGKVGDEISIEEKVLLDYQYKKKMSLFFDLYIVWRTFFKVISGSGIKH
jgi:lipopolysaccharide/colanic/teichoic acid biosynthesis glycosyltransferase